MLKSELIQALTGQLTARYPQLTEQAIRESVDRLLHSIIQHVLRGGRMEIRGFGSFGLRKMQARTIHNPKTGKKAGSPAGYRLYFRAAKQLRLRVNTGKIREIMTSGK